MNEQKRWKTLKQKTVHENPWFCIRESEVLRPDGKPGTHFVLDTPGPAVFTAAFNEVGEICFVKQHRFTTGEIGWELPGGNAGNEDTEAAAKRELEEETGLLAEEWTLHGKWATQNGVCSEYSFVYTARVLSRSTKEYHNEDCVEEVRFFPVESLVEMIRSGEMSDGQSIAALMIVLLKLGKI